MAKKDRMSEKKKLELFVKPIQIHFRWFLNAPIIMFRLIYCKPIFAE